MANGLIWIFKRLVELGLLNVAASAPQRFVEYCEEDYAARVRHAAAQVLQSGARVVMLTGPSSSERPPRPISWPGPCAPPGWRAPSSRWIISSKTCRITPPARRQAGL